nr:PREDICTED: membrane cofactor protein-like [Rhinolophus sinicus]
MWEPKMPECIKVSTTPSPILPTSSHSVSVPTSTQPTISSVSGVKPTAPPDSSRPGPPSPGEPPSGGLGAGSIAGIVIASLIGVALLGCIFAFFMKKKKGEGESSASYSTYQNKSTTPEQTH